MARLGGNRYGKAEVRVVRIARGAGPDGRDVIRDWNVSSSLSGDLASQSTYHGLSGHALLRYVDPIPPTQINPPVSVDDIGVPPPPPGRITPGARTVARCY